MQYKWCLTRKHSSQVNANYLLCTSAFIVSIKIIIILISLSLSPPHYSLFHYLFSIQLHISLLYLVDLRKCDNWKTLFIFQINGIWIKWAPREYLGSETVLWSSTLTRFVSDLLPVPKWLKMLNITLMKLLVLFHS